MNNNYGHNFINYDGNSGCIRYLTRHCVPVYHSAVVDLRHQRTVHSVEHYPCLPDPQRVSGTQECGAVHYGFCLPVMLEDEGRIKVDTRLLTSPEQLDSSLRNLVDQFVARDKAGQNQIPARKGKTIGSPLSSPTSPSQNQPSGLSRLNVSGTPKYNDKTSPPSPSRSISKPNWIIPSNPKKIQDNLSEPEETLGQSSRSISKSDWIKPSSPTKNPKKILDDFSEPKISAEETLGQLLQDLKVAVASGLEIKGGSSASGGGLLLAAVGSRNRAAGSAGVKQDHPKPKYDDIEESLKASLGTPTMNGGGTGITGHDLSLSSQLDKGSGTGSGKYNDGEICLQSPVDYAKKRFQWTQDAQAQQKLEAVTTRVPLNGIPHLVSETKTRFENGLFNQAEVKWKSEWLPNLLPNNYNSASSDGLLHPEYGVGYSGRGTNSPKKSASPEPGVTSSSGTPLPHPKLTSIQKQHIRERALSPTGTNSIIGSTSGAGIMGNGTSPGGTASGYFPVRPFLTKGSVAERVLIFERCPVLDRGANRTHQHHPAKPLFNTWRSSSNSNYTSTAFTTGSNNNADSLFNQTNLQVYNDKENREPYTSPNRNTLWRQSHGSHLHRIPRFYYPSGRPLSTNEIDSQLQRISSSFSKFEGQKVSKEQFSVITKACHLPLYWKVPLFLASGGESKGYVTVEGFLDYWKRVLSTCHDDSSKFVRILSKSNRNFLLPDDFIPFIQDVIETHPGLTFLKEATEFHSRYVHTVIARIYYCANRSWSGRLTIPELRKSNFLQVLAVLEEEDDINRITEYFSYEHFYVIYCKFWELDKDHDLLIDREDLSRHNDNAISSRMIDRIFSGAVTRGKSLSDGKMTYTEFVWFLLSEEDKRHPTSIEYWFRCMDLDGDGFLSMYELEYFYEEQLQRMEALGLETLPFLDCLCQMLDMIQPKISGQISLGDLKRCRMTPIFFDTFFNLEKYLDHEQKDPFASQRDHDGDGIETSDWNRYAEEEYELLVAEEGAVDRQEDLLYDEDYDQEEDELTANLERLAFEGDGVGGLVRTALNAKNSTPMGSDDDYADYAESDDYQY